MEPEHAAKRKNIDPKPPVKRRSFSFNFRGCNLVYHLHPFAVDNPLLRYDPKVQKKKQICRKTSFDGM